MEAIKITNLTKKYKDLAAVDGLDLSIHEGELFSLLGVNGAGKTTTIKMLAGLVKPTSGDAFLFGHSITKDEEKIKGMVDISMQETSVARKLTVRENIRFYASLAGQSKAEIEESERYVFDIFSLAEVADKQAEKLSGGWQRKLSIALALVSDPKNLTGPDYGIFVQGNGNGRPGNGQAANCNWNMDWDRPANIEFITPEKGVAVFNQ